MPSNLPPFWSCLINCSIPKRERFYFVIISSNAPKTRASGLPVEENNVATVVKMNWRCDNFFLNAELLFLCHSGCSVSNEYTPTGIIIVQVQIPNHSLKIVDIEKILLSIWMIEDIHFHVIFYICIITILLSQFIGHVVQIWCLGWIHINQLVTGINYLVC